MPHASSPEMGNFEPSPENLDEEFVTAHESLRRIHDDRDFIQYRSNRNVYNSHDARYNRTLADYAYEYSSEFSPVTEAVLAVNDFVEAQAYLDAHPGRGNVDPAALDHAAYFGKILHRVLDEYPTAKPSQLFNQLVRAVPEASPQVRPQAQPIIRNAVRGVLHERALKQFLTDEALQEEGIYVEVEDSNVQKDLRGSDFRVTINRPHREPVVIDVDAKASLSEIEAKHIEAERRDPKTNRASMTHLPYWVNPHTGTVMMYSLVTDREMGDSFIVPENIVKERSKQAVQLLLLAAQERPQKSGAI